MIDPGRGAGSPHQGALDESVQEAKASKRSRGKRKGRKTSPNNPRHTQNPAAEARPERRPVDGEQQEHIHKRKRRRRQHGRQKSAGAASVAASAPARDGKADSTSQQDAPIAGAKPAPGPDQVLGDKQKQAARSGRRRRRGKGKQGVHVRPLAPVKPIETRGQSASYAPDAARNLRQNEQARNERGAEAGERQKAQTSSRKGKSNAAGAIQRPHEDLYAALDLGTNNCRLLIAQPTRPGQFRVVDAFSRIVRLGEGLGSTGRLSQEAMDRAVEALRICAGKLAHLPIRRKRLIATEACRAATNGEEFLQRVERETGLQLEIINRETEARLAVSGCASLVGRDTRSIVLFDIGGGSSEIAVIRIGENRSNRLANHITHWTSLPVGVVTLSERHGGRDVSPEVFEAMIAEVSAMLDGFECPPLVNENGQSDEEAFHLIGTSGTVTTLAGVHLDLPRYDRRRVDGLWLSDDEVSAMQAKLLSWDYESRSANPCIGPDRADLVLAGCAILEAIRRRWPSSRMRVADRGLREGLLTDMMADDGVWRRGRGRKLGQKDARAR